MRAWALAPVTALLACASSYGCVPATPAVMVPQESRPSPMSPSLDEVARAEPAPGFRSLLVAYPRTPCTATARTVFMDRDGNYFGAVAPGEATLLTLPGDMRTLYAMSSVEIYASTGTRFVFDEVDVPASPDALLLEPVRAIGRQCSTSGHYANVKTVSKHEIEERLADAEIAWMTPRPREGQAWLDAHRPRIDEILGRNRRAER